MSLDLKSLKLFVSVMELGTIVAAARREHIAGAAVSRRISELERSLGVELVTRSNKGLAPTHAGGALLDWAHRILNDLDSVREQMAEYAHGLKGHVRVFANMPAISQFLPTELGTFLKQNPLVQVHIEERVSSLIPQAVAENVADVGIMVMGPPIDGLELHPYHEDDLVVVVPQRHPLARRTSVRFADTVRYDYVALNAQSHINLQLIKAASEQRQSWKSRIQVTSYDALCRMVEADLGIGVLPRRIARAYATALKIRVVNLKETWAHRTLALCIRSRETLTPAARLLVDHLLAEALSSARTPSGAIVRSHGRPRLVAPGNNLASRSATSRRSR